MRLNFSLAVCDSMYGPYTFHISGASDNEIVFYRNEDSRGQLFSPILHVAPVNPGLHLHVNELLPSIHSPPFLQGLLTHSLMSENRVAALGTNIKAQLFKINDIIS